MIEWDKKGDPGDLPALVFQRIMALRRNMLVHCYIYYHLGTNVIDDHMWQDLADELEELQGITPILVDFYDDAFEDWTGSTGYHLPHDAGIIRAAHRLLQNPYVTGEAHKPKRRKVSL